MHKLGIINYGSGNIQAIKNIYDSLFIRSEVINEPHELEECTHIILPGVGHFDHTIKLLGDIGFIDKLNDEVLLNNKFILGICVGMQIMGVSSEEGSLQGLSWFKAKSYNLSTMIRDKQFRLPHMGWNEIFIKKKDLILNEFEVYSGAYFLHNYFMQLEDSAEVIACANYITDIPAVIKKNNIYGIQFHPEKSHMNGINLLKSFASLTG